MALHRTTDWICDICGKVKSVQSTNEKVGLDTPIYWDEREITMSHTSTQYYVRTVLLCGTCISDFISLHGHKETAKEILKKPFWQKIFGKESK